ncbi:hypothetical protein UlMin_022401 [Ulmus minor]
MESTRTVPWEDDEWELFNDDGFVYKRKRRPSLDPEAEPVPPAVAAPVPDPESEEKLRRARKKKTLLKLKSQYQREIDQWEYLSNTLRATEETTRQLQVRRQTLTECSPSGEAPGTESVCGSLVDELLLQAEGQEAFIREASKLCDIAEAMCITHEEEADQSLFDLPIWASSASSPRELMAALCDP